MDATKKSGEVQNRLKAVRTRLGLSQQDLATMAGVARQTIGGIEAGTYALSLTVALRLAKALGCTVDELFWLDSDLATVEATLVGEDADVPAGEPVRVTVAEVNGRWIAFPLVGEGAFRREMLPADGIGTRDAARGSFTVQLLDNPQSLAQTVLVAGCTPALSLWVRSAERWFPGLSVHWSHANSMTALGRLARGEVHMAGVHLLDAETDEENTPFVRQVMGEIPCVLVNLGVWEEGLLVAPGNPKEIASIMDLTRKGVTLINREEGAGSRLLLDSLLKQAGMEPGQIDGYATTVGGHLEVAREIRAGRADTGMSTASVATTFGLSFLPLRSVRYDLALRKDFLKLPGVEQLLETLDHRRIRAQLALLGGYDTTRTGELRDVPPLRNGEGNRG